LVKGRIIHSLAEHAEGTEGMISLIWQKEAKSKSPIPSGNRAHSKGVLPPLGQKLLAGRGFWTGQKRFFSSIPADSGRIPVTEKV